MVPLCPFVTPLVAMKLDILPKVLVEPFLLSTTVSDSLVAKRIYRSYSYLFFVQSYFGRFGRVRHVIFLCNFGYGLIAFWLWIGCMHSMPL